MTKGFLRFLRGNTLALLALFVALGGTTYAATALPKNSVGTKQLKKNAVNGAKIANNTVKGADLLESSLAKVPSATQADSATNATNATHATTAGTAAPSGAAGGALTGTYPAPSIAANVLGSANVIDASQPAGLRKADIGAVSSSTVSFDPPSIPAQTCSSAFATVTGAQTNDIVIAHPVNAIWSNLMYAPWLAQTDSVSLRICNPTAAPIDGIAVPFFVLLIR